MPCPAHNHLDARPSVMHDECSMPDSSDDSPSDTPPKKRRFRLRYSLRSLLLFVLLVNSACLLWMHWEPWTLETTLKGHTAQVNSATFSPDGKQVVTGSHDFTACVWDTFTGERLMVLRPDIGYVLYVGYSRDGNRIITSGRITNAWDAKTGKVNERAPQDHFKFLRWLSITPDGNRFAKSDSTAVVTVMEFPPAPKHDLEGKFLYAWRAHQGKVLSLDFSNDGMRLVTTGKDGLAKIWRK